MSSRNAYLKPEERRAATVLHRALVAVREKVEAGQRDVLSLQAAMRKVLDAEPLASTDYSEIVNADTLEPVMHLRGSCLVVLAVFIGSTRLIDNLLIEEDPREPGQFRLSF